jgi:hypothetical protein
MSKNYLEIIEQLTEEEMLIKQPQEVRIEVSSKEDAIEKLDIYEPAFIGLNYVKRYHICKHEEGQPCEIEVL